ncbi:hypothetical protein ART_3935 [Arthrobacter sp. PAMC 25486]|uniref:thioredoxin domain-containing protein n=1 Tax=Arthrobacter sp. PAMC 25486 TaxID=1494608 RepID=UPI0005361CF8|nr:thioredoxin domain-containing protein [Arthrobacter sp. PAMC 25486]AIY03534.1 hypothetical protein ART_3935 [Arthrobacter sp. PAMC 25486]
MNRLAGEPSAYLRQHATNPVDWQPYDGAAFADAMARDVPIFLSVGYAACHWCHVMAGESFQDPAIAAYLNEHFVSIKVDREERPDVDDAYMAATQALSGEGGWPMTVFLTPDGNAFYAGTYFPPRPGTGRPSFRQVLEAVTEAWRERRDQVLQTAASLAETLAQPLWQVRTTAAQTVQAPSAVELQAGPENSWTEAARLAVAAMLRAEDPVHGGLGQAPKFPPTPGLEFLLRHAAAVPSSEARGLAGRTLGAMVRSALFDRLGGGFARYSVTADWSEPHYEKMLYDNAGLLRVLVHWIRLAGETSQDMPDGGTSTGGPAPLGAAEAADAVAATIGWLMAEMRLPGGAFASSLDADTVIDGVHHEGASYQWTVAELEAADRELAAQVAGFMGIGAGQASPLHPGRELSAAEQAQWARIKPALLAMRARRIMPARDEKVVAAWNAMLMAALAEAAMVRQEPEWLAAAVELGEYLRSVHWDGQLLHRVSHAGQTRGIKGLLEDYAASANGYLSLYAATGDARWFEFAGELVRAIEQEFIADGVVLNRGVTDGSDGAVPGSRTADPFDNATASGVAMLAEAFISWSAYTGSGRHRAMAAAMLASVPELARRAPRSAGGLLGAALALAAGPLEIAIVGPAGAERDVLVRQAWAASKPGLVVAVWDGLGAAPVTLLEGRLLAERFEAGTEPLAYVCRNMVCARPVATVTELRQLLR